MFTGIVESIGTIKNIQVQDGNKTFRIASDISEELKIDQSVAHNGICLTVINVGVGWHEVTAIHETLDLTASKGWKTGDELNLERAAMLHARLDGHIVQGHVDGTGIIKSITDENGSWRYEIEFDKKQAGLVISKGSICIDGVSLTVVSPTLNSFQLAIIPYTYEHTIFHSYKEGQEVNIEFDIIGKYILRQEEISIS